MYVKKEKGVVSVYVPLGEDYSKDLRHTDPDILRQLRVMGLSIFYMNGMRNATLEFFPFDRVDVENYSTAEISQSDIDKLNEIIQRDRKNPKLGIAPSNALYKQATLIAKRYLPRGEMPEKPAKPIEFLDEDIKIRIHNGNREQLKEAHYDAVRGFNKQFKHYMKDLSTTFSMKYFVDPFLIVDFKDIADVNGNSVLYGNKTYVLSRGRIGELISRIGGKMSERDNDNTIAIRDFGIGVQRPMLDDVREFTDRTNNKELKKFVEKSSKVKKDDISVPDKYLLDWDSLRDLSVILTKKFEPELRRRGLGPIW